MTEQDTERQEDLALAKCLRLQRSLTAARNRAAAIADEMVDLAQKIKSQHTSIAFESYSWLKPETISGYVSDVALAESELFDARKAAEALGVTPPKVE